MQGSDTVRTRCITSSRLGSDVPSNRYDSLDIADGGRGRRCALRIAAYRLVQLQLSPLEKNINTLTYILFVY